MNRTKSSVLACAVAVLGLSADSSFAQGLAGGLTGNVTGGSASSGAQPGSSIGGGAGAGLGLSNRAGIGLSTQRGVGGSGLNTGLRVNSGAGAGANASVGGLRTGASASTNTSGGARVGILSRSKDEDRSASSKKPTNSKDDAASNESNGLLGVTAHERAAANATLSLNQRLAEIDRMRDRAIATGNTEVLAQADKLEAQARAQYEARIEQLQEASQRSSKSSKEVQAQADGNVRQNLNGEASTPRKNNETPSDDRRSRSGVRPASAEGSVNGSASTRSSVQGATQGVGNAKSRFSNADAAALGIEQSGHSTGDAAANAASRGRQSGATLSGRAQQQGNAAINTANGNDGTAPNETGRNRGTSLTGRANADAAGKITKQSKPTTPSTSNRDGARRSGLGRAQADSDAASDADVVGQSRGTPLNSSASAQGQQSSRISASGGSRSSNSRSAE